jgi:tetratricopeptide (TPR) repeat protein
VQRVFGTLLLLAACGGEPDTPAAPVTGSGPTPAAVEAPALAAPDPGAPPAAELPPAPLGPDAVSATRARELIEQARTAEHPSELYEQARALLLTSLEQQPDQPEIRLVLANVGMAELSFTNPDRARAAALRAEAAEQFQAVLDAEPSHARALSGLADVHMVAHTDADHQRAVELFERALAVQPGDPMVLVRLGEAQHRLGRYPAAESNLLAAMAASEAAGDPTGVINAKNLLGRMYMDQGRMEDAERVLEESAAGLEALADKSSYYGCPYQALGALYQQSGRMDESVAAMKRVAELEPHSVDSQLLAARACREVGDEACAADYQARAEALRQR